jgi:hypothetical protein
MGWSVPCSERVLRGVLGVMAANTVIMAGTSCPNNRYIHLFRDMVLRSVLVSIMVLPHYGDGAISPM